MKLPINFCRKDQLIEFFIIAKFALGSLLHSSNLYVENGKRKGFEVSRENKVSQRARLLYFKTEF